VRLRLLDHDSCVRYATAAADTLSDDELSRASRFRFERDRREFVSARCALRDLVGEALGMNPRDVDFRYGREGKPFVDDPSGLEFNVSHAKGIAIIGAAFGPRVGVDVELVGPNLFDGGLAERLLTRRELQAVRELPADRQDEALTAFWTRKEAYVKAAGGGLSIPLSSFSVSFLPGETAQLYEAGSRQPLRGWSIAAFAPAPGYLAAVVVEGEGWSTYPSETRAVGADLDLQKADVSKPPQTSDAGLK
jgi:4'-phosphopantetheinyl transferase